MYLVTILGIGHHVCAITIWLWSSHILVLIFVKFYPYNKNKKCDRNGVCMFSLVVKSTLIREDSTFNGPSSRIQPSLVIFVNLILYLDCSSLYFIVSFDHVLQSISSIYCYLIRDIVRASHSSWHQSGWLEVAPHNPNTITPNVWPQNWRSLMLSTRLITMQLLI